MESFRLIHISDLHLSTKEGWLNGLTQKGSRFGWTLKNLYKGKQLFYPSTFDSSLVQATTSHLKRISNEIDSLIITGDLATTGRDEDLTTAIDFLQGKVPTSWGVMPIIPDILGMNFPTIILPGNHDRYSNRVALPGNRNFEVVFGDNWDAGQDVMYSEFGSDCVRSVALQKGKEALVICCADFTLEWESDADTSAFSYLGQGFVYPERLEALQLETIQFSSNAVYENAHIIWAVHFPPSYKEIDPKLSLKYEAELIRAAKEENVSCILAGHTHHQRCYVEDDVRVFCAGTVCSVDYEYPGRNSFLDLEFKVENGGAVEIIASGYEYSDSQDCFVCIGEC